MNSQELISIYDTIADISRKMVEAAKESDWALLAHLEASYNEHVQTIKDNKDTPLMLAEKERETKVHVINKILADDREIHHIIRPRIAQLSELIQRSSKQLKIKRAYSPEQL